MAHTKPTIIKMEPYELPLKEHFYYHEIAPVLEAIRNENQAYHEKPNDPAHISHQHHLHAQLEARIEKHMLPGNNGYERAHNAAIQLYEQAAFKEEARLALSPDPDPVPKAPPQNELARARIPRIPGKTFK